MARPFGGEQFVLVAGGARAVVTEVGAGLRELSSPFGPVVWGYPGTELCSGSRGQVLMPWPNRIEDGTYRFQGRSCSLPLDEPARQNAIHGLVRWLPWSVTESSEAAVSLACDLAPCPGYPWWLRCDVSYHLDPEGSLEVEMGALNCSDRAAPFGAGFHPYLDPGEGGVDSVASLTLPAGRRLILDGRGIPRSSESVLGGPYDFSAGRPLIGMRLDDCFTELPETWTARLQMSDGSVTELWADAAWRYAMCFTADTLAGPDKRRAVAIEPMTCPPNAFRSAEGLVCLGPGERFSARFGIRRLRGQ